MDTSDLAMRLGLALAIGFLVGLERGWRERDNVIAIKAVEAGKGC